jgi:hypothetical protein
MRSLGCQQRLQRLVSLISSWHDKDGKESINLKFGFQLERENSESTSSLRRSKERVSELEQRVSYMEKVKSWLMGCAISLIHRLTFAVSSFDEWRSCSLQRMLQLLMNSALALSSQLYAPFFHSILSFVSFCYLYNTILYYHNIKKGILLTALVFEAFRIYIALTMLDSNFS